MSNEDRDPLVVADEGGKGSGSSAAAEGRDGHPHLPVWQESLLLLGIALVLAIVIKAFFVQAFYIPSESMEPGLQINDRILVEKVSLWAGEPQRGDIVGFEDPGNWLSAAEKAGPSNPITQVMSKIGLYPTGGHLVKRVVGVAGDTVECCDAEGRIQVNGEPLDEAAYVKNDKFTSCNGPMIGNCDWSAGPIPAGHLFVMGDNRGHSADSSQHMCAPKATECVSGDEYVATDLVVGKVKLLLWPADHFRWVSRPDSFADVPNGS